MRSTSRQVRTKLGPAQYAVGLAALCALTACATEQAERTATGGIPRHEAEATATAMLERIIGVLPASTAVENPDHRWTLLACSDAEIQAGTAVDLSVGSEVSAADLFDAIKREVEPDGYRTEQVTSRTGDPRLVVSGDAEERYFITITITDDSTGVSIGSFSPCFVGALTDD